MIWESIEEEVRGEIMKTDVFIRIFFQDGQRILAENSLWESFGMFRDFDERYSRFRQNNDLWRLNESESLNVSPELFALLEEAAKMHRFSSGLFDPAILPILEGEGYRGAYDSLGRNSSDHHFSEVILEKADRHVTKPRSLKIDLGGIGKGFIVDRVSEFLKARFDHFLVDAGGDIRVHGEDQEQDINGWAIALEDPRDKTTSLGTLILHDQSIATSGLNRRHWMKGDSKKHHLIDPVSKASSASDLVSVTVIAPTTLLADVLAKTLFLSGVEMGFALSEKEKIPAVFVSPQRVTMNPYAQKLLWSA